MLVSFQLPVHRGSRPAAEDDKPQLEGPPRLHPPAH
jgi:hypothetical protein